ncbi:MAG: efflux RND transporter permease subunit [Endomicrobia bacterium]|nr:efflux RND transporter permease subunit [Endomicrobiia bacterium]MDW8056237.1 efflux RND transporter permease subunit [Elusimicrobiota bacterium]
MFRLPVDRPTLVSMFFVGVALFGIISALRLPQELFPSFEYPQITVITKYAGAGPQEAEKLLTRLVEETVKTAKNISRVWSISKEGTSIVVCEFHWGTDINFAALEVREKLDLIKERLPKDAHEPIVLKYNPFKIEAMNLSVRYKTPQTDPYKLAELRLICKKYLKDEFERIEGVAKVDLYGGTEKEIIVDVDRNRLVANNLSLLDVIKVLRESNITYPAGTIKEEQKEFTVKTVGEFKTVEDIKSILIPVERYPRQERIQKYVRRKPKEEQHIIYLSDIAEVYEGIKDIKGYSRINKQDHISVAVYQQSKTNLIKLSKSIRKKLEELKQTKIPQDVIVEIIYDQADFIKSSLNNIYISALQGGFLAFIVLYIFLKDIIASVIICISIPLAILATLSFMYFSGLSLNTMSLGGLALGVGMLVDNSIVVLEKIFAEKVKQPSVEKKEIIYSSTVHVVGDIISSTLTTVAIFLPLVFVGGVIGKLFKELALTVSFSLASSILVALFLVPRLALWLNLENYINKVLNNSTTTTFEKKLSLFSLTLGKFLKLKVIYPIRILAVYLISGILILYIIPKEFMPKIDERKFIINLTLPSTSTLENTNKVVSEIEDFISKLKEVKNIIVNIGSAEEEKAGQVEVLGPNQARIIVNLKKTGKTTSEIVSMIAEKIKKIPQKIETEFITQQGLFGTGIGTSAAVVVEVKGKELKKIETVAKQVAEFLQNLPNVYGIKVIPAEPTKEVKFEIAREKASLFGITVQDIATTVIAAIKGYSPTTFKQQEDEIDIRVRFQEKYRTTLSEAAELTIYSPILDKHIYIGQLSEIKLTNSLPEIRRVDGERTYIVSANTKKGFRRTISKLASYLNKVEKKNPEVKTKITGEMLAIQEALSSSIFSLILSIIIIYMILASQFESLIYPLITMVTIPLGLFGATFALFFSFNSINAISMLGFIMLIGIVVNNGILLVSEYNFYKEKFPYKNLKDIVVEVTQERLRPILMTTLTTVVGLLPMALGIPSKTVNSSMAVAILGGLTFALFLTLFFVPWAYLQINYLIKKLNY